MDINKNLADAFGIVSPVKTPNIIDTTATNAETTPIVQTPAPNDVETEDYKFAKSQLKTLAEIAVKAVKTNVEMADQLQEPRMYNTLTESIRAAKEIATELATLETEKKKMEIEKNKAINSDTTNVQNNVLFVGTAAELLDLYNPARALHKDE